MVPLPSNNPDEPAFYFLSFCTDASLFVKFKVESGMRCVNENGDNHEMVILSDIFCKLMILSVQVSMSSAHRSTVAACCKISRTQREK